MLLRKKKQKTEPNLLDMIYKTTDSGFVFWNINDDLGLHSEQIMKSSPLIKMSYGYARRSAAAALYIQGLFDQGAYDQACAIFKALQQQTEQTIEFQEAAAADASEFLKSYHYMITKIFEVAAIQIANNYDLPKQQLSDAELIGTVIETAHNELQ